MNGSQGLVALVVDDEEGVLDEVRYCVEQDGRCSTVLTAARTDDALRMLTGRQAVDIAFLDIHMPGLSGIELARIGSAMAVPPQIVFVTAHPRYTGEAFDLDVADYVVKPMPQIRISEAITRAIRKQRDGVRRGSPGAGPPRPGTDHKSVDFVLEPLPRPRAATALSRLLGRDNRVRHQVREASTLQRARNRDAEAPTRAFLSYARDDSDRTRELFTRLTKDWVSCWFDQDRLLPGQDWRMEVERAIRRSRYFLACLTRQSVAGAGYRHTELQQAIDIATELPEGQVFVVPVRFEPCPIPDRLAHLQAVDLFRPDGYQRLLTVLREGR